MKNSTLIKEISDVNSNINHRTIDHLTNVIDEQSKFIDYQRNCIKELLNVLDKYDKLTSKVINERTSE